MPAAQDKTAGFRRFWAGCIIGIRPVLPYNKAIKQNQPTGYGKEGNTYENRI